MPASAGERVLGRNLHPGAGLTPSATTIWQDLTPHALSGWARSLRFCPLFFRALVNTTFRNSFQQQAVANTGVMSSASLSGHDSFYRSSAFARPLFTPYAENADVYENSRRGPRLGLPSDPVGV